MTSVRYPSLYQINTRLWLTELSQGLGRPATLDDIPDAELDGLAKMGFDFIWLLSVWQTRAEGAEDLAQQSRVAAGVSRDPSQSTTRGRYSRIGLRHHRLHRACRSGRRRCGTARVRGGSGSAG